MYMLYESYSDEVKGLLNRSSNTAIKGIYEDKKVANEELDKLIERTINNISIKFDWYVKEMSKKLIDSNNEVKKVYEVFNEYIDNIEERYLIILERVEVYHE